MSEDKKKIGKLKVLAVGKKLSSIKAGMVGSCGTVGCACGTSNYSTLYRDYYAWLATDFLPGG